MTTLQKATTEALNKKLDKLEIKIQGMLGFDEDSDKYHALVEQVNEIEAVLMERANTARVNAYYEALCI